MWKYLFYPAFGLGVLGSYGSVAFGGRDVTSVDVRRGVMPAGYQNATNFAAAPIVWRTGFHGPAAPRMPSSSSTYRTSGYRTRYGGSSWGK